MSCFKGVCLSVISLASTLGLANSSDFPLPIEIPATVEKLQIPFGFDDNDNVEVLASGFLEDSCKRVGRTSYRVDNERKVVHVWVTTFDYKTQDVFCYEMLTPFLVKVKVGLLKQGNYKIELDGRPDKEIETYVAKSTTQLPDAFLYAPVADADLVVNERGEQTVTIKGEFPRMANLTDCMIMKEIRTYKAPEDVLVVLPIAEIASGVACTNYKHQFKFNHKVKASDAIKGDALLHVRVTNGESLNRVVSDTKATAL